MSISFSGMITDIGVREPGFRINVRLVTSTSYVCNLLFCGFSVLISRKSGGHRIAGGLFKL